MYVPDKKYIYQMGAGQMYWVIAGTNIVVTVVDDRVINKQNL